MLCSDIFSAYLWLFIQAAPWATYGELSGHTPFIFLTALTKTRLSNPHVGYAKIHPKYSAKAELKKLKKGQCCMPVCEEGPGLESGWRPRRKGASIKPALTERQSTKHIYFFSEQLSCKQDKNFTFPKYTGKQKWTIIEQLQIA